LCQWIFLHSARHGTGEAVAAGESDLATATTMVLEKGRGDKFICRNRSDFQTWNLWDVP